MPHPVWLDRFTLSIALFSCLLWACEGSTRGGDDSPLPEGSASTSASLNPSAPTKTAAPSPPDALSTLHLPPQSRVRLEGPALTCGPGAQITWTLDEPAGSAVSLKPSAHVLNPEVEANVVGTYLAERWATDAEGEPCGESFLQAFSIEPVAPLYVELTWHTPGDANETDEGVGLGSDVDLHVAYLGSPSDGAHTGETPDWFHERHDCYWLHGTPQWGDVEEGALHSPSLDRDDTDGAGPETVAISLPADGSVYALGVHYYADHNFGPAYVTARIYVAGQLIATLGAVELDSGELYDAARIHWPSGEVIEPKGEAGEPVIFEHPGIEAW